MTYRRLVIVTFALLAFVGPVVYADNQTSAMVTSDQLSLIRQNCVTVQASITRLHASDALARVHLGQEYETISTKLMTPLNSRAVLDKYDASDIIKTAANFNAKLDLFRTQYQHYDEAISSALQMNCRDQPASFLDILTQARDDRTAVQDTVTQMSGIVQQYRTQVTALQAQVKDLQSTKGQN